MQLIMTTKFTKFKIKQLIENNNLGKCTFMEAKAEFHFERSVHTIIMLPVYNITITFFPYSLHYY